MRRYLENCTANYIVLATVTYASIPTDGRAVKRHLDTFARQLSAYQLMPRSLFWILEFQRRGAPHYHFLSTDFIDKWALSWLWHFSSQQPPKTATNVKSIRKPLQYALKYANKLEQKQVPEQYQGVGRLWGILGSRLVHTLERVIVGIPRSDVGGMIRYERFLEESDGKRVCTHAAGFVSFPKHAKSEV